MMVWRRLQRLLRHSPGFTIAAVSILALSIGANTVVFSILYGILLRPLPYRDPGRLFAVQEVLPALIRTYPTIPVSAYDFEQWRKHTAAFDGLALVDGAMASLTLGNEPERVPLARVSANLFRVLGIEPSLGRAFREEEDLPGNDRVVIISDSLWRRRFQGNPSVLGQSITLDGLPYQIIGIAPRNMPVLRASQLRPAGPQDMPPEIWKPFAATKDELHPFGDWNYSCIARLKKGVSPAQGLAELNAVDASIDAGGREKSGLHTVLIPLREQIAGKARRGLVLLFLAVFAVLVIGCANIANLVLVRANGKRRDWAIQSALGATTGVLVRQTLKEALLVAALGGLGGLLVADIAIKALVASRIDLPRLQEIGLDWNMLGVNFVLAGLAGVLLGLLPFLRWSHHDLADTLKSSAKTLIGAKGRKLRSLLVCLEVGVATTCLICAGLLLHSFSRLMHVDDGFQAQHVITVALDLPELRYRERPQRASLVEAVSQRLALLPGVQAVGVSSLLPLTGEGDNNMITVEGTNTPKEERPAAEFRSVNPDFFKALGIHLEKGRIFQESDKPRNVVVISQQAAALFFPQENPLGKRFHLGDESRPLLEVVGVVADVRGRSLDKAPDPTIYLPYWHRLGFDLFVAVRTQLAASAISPSFLTTIHQIDPELPVSQVRTMQEVVDGSLEQRKFQLGTVSVFAMIATILTAIGIYSVVSYAMSQRTNELGLRLALGSSRPRVVWLVLRQAMVPALIGLALGLISSFILGKLFRSSLFEVLPYDPWTFFPVTVLIVIVGLLAAFLPALRAVSMDPVRALRYE